MATTGGPMLVSKVRNYRLFYSCYFCLCVVLLITLHFCSRYFGLVRVNSLLQLPQLVRQPVIRVFLNNTVTDATDFRYNWRRLQKARVDWRGMLSPCKGNMEWGNVKSGWEKQGRTSARESYIEHLDIRPAGDFSRIFIRSRTANGREKTFGGDSWRVNLEGPSNVAATIFDHDNGRYEAMALIMEPGQYTVKAILDFSLCDGLRDPPENWFRVGNAQGKNQESGILGLLDDYFGEQLHEGESISTIQIPPNNKTEIKLNETGCSETCGSLWNGYGRWVKDSWLPYISESRTGLGKTTQPSNERKGKLWIYGDSLAVRFHQSLSGQQLCTGIFTSCGLSYNWVYTVPGWNEQLAKKINDDFDFRPGLILESIREVLRRDDMRSNESLLVLNLGLHYPISINFTTYQRLITDVIGMLKKREQELGSKANVIWKTVTAIRKENIDHPPNETHWRFFTYHRVQLFDTFAMSAMCKAGIDVLDVYHLTASYPKGPIDVVHYTNDVFREAELKLEQYVVAEFGKNLRRVCTG